MKQIYLDNAATTAVDPKVYKIMSSYFIKKYGNASEFHLLGTEAKMAVEKARARVADFLGAKQNEIIFTGSATESINLAIKGLIESTYNLGMGKAHIITTLIEHKAVLETCRHLEIQNLVEVTYLKVDSTGMINFQELQKSVSPQTVLVSIGYVNNEVGTVQEIRKIGLLIKSINMQRKKRIYFHTDATQALMYYGCKVNSNWIDLLSFSGHKIGAPKGIGVLYKRNELKITRQIDGGAQEMGLRSGTENTPCIVGLGEAIERIKVNKKIKTLREKLIKGVLNIPGTSLTGHTVFRAPHIASFVIDGVEGEAMVLRLSDNGIIASSGSACTSSSLSPSHVLTAMGINPEKSHGSLRFSLSKNTTALEINYVIKKLPRVVKDLRIMAPSFK